MLLTLFIVLQLALDAGLVLFLLVSAPRRKAAPARAPASAPLKSAPPAWYRDFLCLAEDVMALVEPVIDVVESGRLGAAPAAPAPTPAADLPVAQRQRDRHREAFALLRAGTPPEEVARRERLLPGELRLIRNLVAAESEFAESRGR
jgi:hypothetical protein